MVVRFIIDNLLFTACYHVFGARMLLAIFVVVYGPFGTQNKCFVELQFYIKNLSLHCTYYIGSMTYVREWSIIINLGM